MAKAEFSNKVTVSGTAAFDVTTQLNNQTQGIQDEMEQRGSFMALNGIVSGFTPTYGTSSITLAAGRAYVVGNAYTGSATVSMVGYPSGTYNGYIDGDATAAPWYKATTSSLTANQLPWGAFTFNGSTITTSSTTNRTRGVIPVTYEGDFAGTVSSGDIRVRPVARGFSVDDFEVMVPNANGTTGSVLVDLHIGPDGSQGTTVYVTQGNRPTILAATAHYTVASGGALDGTRVATAGQHLAVIIDQIYTGGTISDLGWRVTGRLT